MMRKLEMKIEVPGVNDGRIISTEVKDGYILLKFEVEEGSAEIYEYLDMKYYIFSNMDQLQIIWLENHYECVISGNISINDAKSMINSIQRGVS